LRAVCGVPARRETGIEGYPMTVRILSGVENLVENPLVSGNVMLISQLIVR
jgi:hypothetical protein